MPRALRCSVATHVSLDCLPARIVYRPKGMWAQIGLSLQHRCCHMPVDAGRICIWLPLALQAVHLQMCAVASMAKLRKAVDQYCLIGVTGLQNGGKSTLTERLIGRQVNQVSISLHSWGTASASLVSCLKCFPDTCSVARALYTICTFNQLFFSLQPAPHSI